MINAILRIIGSAIAGVFYLSRINYSLLGKSLENYDVVYSSYAGSLLMEIGKIYFFFGQYNIKIYDLILAQTHPVMLIFSAELCKITFKDEFTGDYLIKRETEKHSDKDIKSKRISLKWSLFYTLSNNLQLVQYRKPEFNTNSRLNFRHNK